MDIWQSICIQNIWRTLTTQQQAITQMSINRRMDKSKVTYIHIMECQGNNAPWIFSCFWTVCLLKQRKLAHHRISPLPWLICSSHCNKVRPGALCSHSKDNKTYLPQSQMFAVQGRDFPLCLPGSIHLPSKVFAYIRETEFLFLSLSERQSSS